MSAANSSTTKRGRKDRPTTPEAVQAAFVPCGRCSFFLSGYRLIHADFEQAVAQSEKQRLQLSGGQDTRLLLHKCFGIRVDVQSQHYEMLCQECQRRYVYEGGGEEGGELLLVAIEPGHS